MRILSDGEHQPGALQGQPIPPAHAFPLGNSACPRPCVRASGSVTAGALAVEVFGLDVKHVMIAELHAAKSRIRRVVIPRAECRTGVRIHGSDKAGIDEVERLRRPQRQGRQEAGGDEKGAKESDVHGCERMNNTHSSDSPSPL